MNCLWVFTIFVNAWFGKGTGFQPGAVLTSVIDMFMFFMGNSNTSLLLFLKCHIY